MDTSRIGIATARAMERIEALVERGDIDQDASVGACLVVVALDHPTPDDAEDRDNLYDTSTQVFTFCDPDVLYVKEGLIRLASEDWH